MRDDLSSTTAAIVAAARGAAGVDPIATTLLPPGFAQLARPGPWSILVPLRQYMKVRTLAIDEVVVRGAGEGIEQLVVLGAGLCARAWRMEALRTSTVFEVDYPSTQAYKRRRLEGRTPTAHRVVHVSIDFEKDDLPATLAAAGHDGTKPTTWIWEGVTPYLTSEATRATLRSIRQRSARGSRLAMTYNTPPRGRIQHGLQALAYPLFVVIGEPFVGLMDPDTAKHQVESAGFTIEGDASYRALARRMGLRRPIEHVIERLLIAVVSGV